MTPPALGSEVPLPLRDHATYAEDFGRWALAHCLFRDRCWGGVAALHRRFEDWCAERDLPGGGPHLPAFAALLAEEGFTLERGMAYGLLLREDWEAAHAAPPSSPAPRPATGATRKPICRGDLLWKP